MLKVPSAGHKSPANGSLRDVVTTLAHTFKYACYGLRYITQLKKNQLDPISCLASAYTTLCSQKAGFFKTGAAFFPIDGA